MKSLRQLVALFGGSRSNSGRRGRPHSLGMDCSRALSSRCLCHHEQLEHRRQLAGASSGFDPPIMPTTETNTTQTVRVLVVSFDPLVPSQGNKHLYEIFENWMNPRELASQYKSEMEYASGGAIKYEITEWRDVNDIPVLSNGYDYTPDEYYRNTLTNSGWQPNTVYADFPSMASSQNFAAAINSGAADEVWLFGEHNFMLFGETWMAGPGSFYVNGPVFEYPEAHRPFVGTGFDYGRSAAEAMHCTCLLYTSPSPRDGLLSRMPSSA